MYYFIQNIKKLENLHILFKIITNLALQIVKIVAYFEKIELILSKT